LLLECTGLWGEGGSWGSGVGTCLGRRYVTLIFIANISLYHYIIYTLVTPHSQAHQGPHREKSNSYLKIGLDPGGQPYPTPFSPSAWTPFPSASLSRTLDFARAQRKTLRPSSIPHLRHIPLRISAPLLLRPSTPKLRSNLCRIQSLTVYLNYKLISQTNVQHPLPTPPNPKLSKGRVCRHCTLPNPAHRRAIHLWCSAIHPIDP